MSIPCATSIPSIRDNHEHGAVGESLRAVVKERGHPLFENTREGFRLTLLLKVKKNPRSRA